MDAPSISSDVMSHQYSKWMNHRCHYTCLDERVDHLVEVVIVPSWVVLDGAAHVVPSNVGAVPARSQLARKDLGGRAKRLRSLPDPFWPLVLGLALRAHSPVQVLVVGTYQYDESSKCATARQHKGGSLLPTPRGHGWRAPRIPLRPSLELT